MIKLNNIKNKLEDYIVNQFNNHKDPNKQHYNIGDTVYTIFTGEVLSAKIDSIDDYRVGSNSSGYVFYWIKLDCYGWFDEMIEKIKFHLFLDILRLPYHPSKKCPGHSLGIEELFDDQKSAEFALKLYSILNQFDELTEEE